MNMRRIGVPVLASLFAGLAMPLVYVVVESLLLWEPLVASDLAFAYGVVAPFTLLAAFVLAWPAMLLQRDERPLGRRLVVAAAICFVAGTALVAPFADGVPWKAGLVAVTTLLLWVAGCRFGLARMAKHRSAGTDAQTTPMAEG